MGAIRDRIMTSPELQASLAARDIDALVDGLNAQGVTSHQSRYVTARTILAECADGAAILDTLQAIGANVSAVKWMMNFLQQDSGMDAGHPRTLANIDTLVTAGVLSASFAEQIRSLSLMPNVVTRQEVESEMFNPDGTEK